MKKISIVLCCTFVISIFTFAQLSAQSKIPATVEKAFKAKFPAATKVKWEKEGKAWEAEFLQNKVETSVVFGADGKWIETEVRIEFNALPEAVQQQVKTSFKDYKANEFNKIEHSVKGLYYEVEFQQAKDKMDVMFNSNGKVLERKLNTEK